MGTIEVEKDILIQLIDGKDVGLYISIFCRHLYNQDSLEYKELYFKYQGEFYSVPYVEGLDNYKEDNIFLDYSNSDSMICDRVYLAEETVITFKKY